MTRSARIVWIGIGICVGLVGLVLLAQTILEPKDDSPQGSVVTLPQFAARQHITAQASVQVRGSRSITTLVLNGTHRPGLARRVNARLRAHGVETRRLARWVPNAPRPFRRTVVFFDSTQQGASAAAVRLRTLTGGGELKPMTPAIRRYAVRAHAPMTVIILGSSFRG